MDEIHKVGAITSVSCWILGLIGGLIMYFTINSANRSAWVTSYVLGLCLGLLTMGIMIKGARKASKIASSDDGESPTSTNIIYIFLRLLVVAAILAVVVFDQFIFSKDNPKFNIWATLIGYLLTKIALVVAYLIVKGKVKKE